MNKYISLCLALLLSASMSFAQESKSIRQGYEDHPTLSGDVAMVVIKEYHSPEAINSGIADLSYTYKFNTHHNVEESFSTDNVEQLVSQVKYVYIPADGLLKEKINYNNLGEVTFTFYYTHDEAGDIIASSRYASNGVINKMTYARNEMGNVTEAISYFQGKVAVKLTYMYDSHGNKSKQTTLNFNDVVIAETSYIHKYNQAGKLEETTTLDKDYNVIGKDIFSYDENGHLVELTSYDNSGTVSSKQTYKYDQQDNRIEELSFTGDSSTPQSRIEYVITYREDSANQSFADEGDKVFDSPKELDVQPMFKGGDLNTFRAWVSKKFQFPTDALQANAQGVLIVEFIIEKDGSLSNIKFLMSPHPSYNKVIQKLLDKSPKWSPGYINEQPVRVKAILPISIKFY